MMRGSQHPSKKARRFASLFPLLLITGGLYTVLISAGIVSGKMNAPPWVGFLLGSAFALWGLRMLSHLALGKKVSSGGHSAADTVFWALIVCILSITFLWVGIFATDAGEDEVSPWMLWLWPDLRDPAVSHAVGRMLFITIGVLGVVWSMYGMYDAKRIKR